jgi:hypothetical protein
LNEFFPRSDEVFGLKKEIGLTKCFGWISRQSGLLAHTHPRRKKQE